MNADIFKEEEGASEFDERSYGGRPGTQPLKIFARRYRNRGVVVFHWEMTNRPGWENPRVVGRKYRHHVPADTIDESEPNNPSCPIIGGSEDIVGTTGEIELKAGTTGYFGFWLKGARQVINKKAIRPRLERKKWHAPHPITVSVYMPEKAESIKTLTERRDAVKIKAEIVRMLRALEEQPKSGDPELEKLRVAKEKNALLVKESARTFAEENEEKARVDAQPDTSPDEKEYQKGLIHDHYEIVRSEIAALMTSERRA